MENMQFHFDLEGNEIIISSVLMSVFYSTCFKVKLVQKCF